MQSLLTKTIRDGHFKDTVCSVTHSCLEVTNKINYYNRVTLVILIRFNILLFVFFTCFISGHVIGYGYGIGLDPFLKFQSSWNA